MVLTKEQVEARGRWSAALRSGKYQQGQHVLRDDDGKHCCLGVACDLYDPTQWTLSNGGRVGGQPRTLWGASLQAPPAMVANVFGIDDQQMATLMRLNDSARYTFPQIADVIDQHTAEWGPR